MAVASPTPMVSFQPSHVSRLPSSRPAIRRAPHRPRLVRSDTPPSTNLDQHIEHFSLNDSSDDELPLPMKFSALTSALLAGENSMLDSSTPILTSDYHNGRPTEAVERSRAWLESTRRLAYLPTQQSNSPIPPNGSPLVRRVVRISGTPRSSIAQSRRTVQQSSKASKDQSILRAQSPVNISTPVPASRVTDVPSSLSAERQSHRSLHGDCAAKLDHVYGERDGTSPIVKHVAVPSGIDGSVGYDSVSRVSTSAVGRNRHGEESGVQSSMRVKRVGKVAGNFLSGPARRGKRRQSEEDQDEEEQRSEPRFQGSHEKDTGDGPVLKGNPPGPTDLWDRRASPIQDMSVYITDVEALATSGNIYSKEQGRSDINLMSEPQSGLAASEIEQRQARVQPKQPLFRIHALPPDMPSAHDQENEAPPTFKRNKATTFALLDKAEKVATRPQALVSDHVGTISPGRRVLAPRNQNTPRRPAPAPPRMSVLETATATAGAAAVSQASKKRNVIRINGKCFTRLDIIGRGGSSKVWRVMAENGKMLALKRVSLEAADESAIRGFKGEIDLLKRLEGNDRVVRMLDFEINDDKQTLSVLMEMGELDFNKILTLRMNSENAVFDPCFVRHYWKEMLECIRTVHACDIVHSDLKPNNFVLVQGCLKLIDFGIANAIQIDETVNVHRDMQIGTPNYMSPESLMDANELPSARGLPAANGAKIMKLGKPSDIWSLGCILYQMTYGRQPFAHIQNQMSRCRAIVDWNHDIAFADTGIGGVQLPKSLIETMQQCLKRDQLLRPTVEQLLSNSNQWLYPNECPQSSLHLTEELLDKIMQSLAPKIKGSILKDAELFSCWSASLMTSIKQTAAHCKQ